MSAAAGVTGGTPAAGGAGRRTRPDRAESGPDARRGDRPAGAKAPDRGAPDRGGPANPGARDEADVTLVLPGQLRDLAGGRAAVRLDGRPGTVREALDALRADHPAVHRRLVTEQGELRPHLNVFVGGTDVRHLGGLDARLEEGAELVVLPSVSGG